MALDLWLALLGITTLLVVPGPPVRADTTDGSDDTSFLATVRGARRRLHRPGQDRRDGKCRLRADR